MLSLGPVLCFRGAEHRAWNLSALVATAADDEPAPLRTEADGFRPCRLARRGDRTLWRYDFALPVGETGGPRDYAIGAQSWRVSLPTPGGALRLAFTACNGSEQGNTWRSPEKRNACWLDLIREHARDPFHLLLQGGDQLYADTMWREVPALAEWRRLPWPRRRRVPFSPEMADSVADYYFGRYCWLWAQPELAPILAGIPSLMMWDDHDIFDGWGSYPPGWQECPVFQGIWSAAREAFALFQLAARPDDLPQGFSDRRGGQFGWAYRIGDIGILAPDLRSERTRSHIMGEAGWDAFMRALESMAGCRHILLISTVPLVNAHLPALERLFDLVPGHQSWQDDLIDQWPSLAHWSEWERMLHTLLGFSARTGARITSLSGEIHLGAFGLIEKGETRIHQLTSSGIVHPPPSRLEVAGLEWVSTRDIRIAPDIVVKLLPIPGLGRRYLRARNWLELELPGNGLFATWRAEGTAAASPMSIRLAETAQ